MSRPILIAQISDLHIKRQDALAYGRVDTAAALSRCIDELNHFSPRPDLVVISGDLADTAAKEEYDNLKTLLDASTLSWLDLTLGASPERPALLFLHHPPFVTGITHMDVQNLRNADALAAILRRHPRARLVAAGHVHRAALTMFAGIPATICPAPNHAVALDLSGQFPPSFKIEPPGFHLHAWFSNDGYGEVVTHFVPIGNFDGPHRFFGPDGRHL